MKLSVLDLIVFIVLTLGSVIFGASFFFKNRTTSQFTSGGGKLPGWIVGFSLFAAFLSSISFLGLPGKAYISNWNAFVFSLSIPIAAILSIRFFVPLYRSLGSISAYHYLEVRFGAWASIYASICYILTKVMHTGAILLLLALPLNALFGWSIEIIIICTGITVTLYSMLGGIQAVIWTDAIQGIIPQQIFEIAAANHKFSLGSFGSSLKDSTFWVVLIYGLFMNLQNFGIDQNNVQRYMTTSSEKEAKSSAFLGYFLYIPLSMILFYIGTALFAYYTAHPDLLPAELRVAGAGDKIFPFFIAAALPDGLKGLLIASIFAAGMSNVSTNINGTATIILSDYYKKYFNKHANEKSSMRVLYGSSVIVGGWGVIIALLLVGVKSVLDSWWILASIFSGGMLGLFLLGYLSKSARNIDAIIGVIVGVLIIIWMSLSPLYFTEGKLQAFRSPFHEDLTVVFGTLAITLVGFLLAKLFAKGSEKSR